MNYSTDKPISSHEQDRYGRKDYANKLASLLSNNDIKDDFVVGLYSKWGYGKSSVLEMVKEYVGDDAIIIPFNPWIFENQTAIVTGLLFRLGEELDKKLEPPIEENNESKAKTKLRTWNNKRTKNGTLTTADTASKLIKDYSGIVGVGLNLATGIPAAGAGSNAVLDLAEKYLKKSSIEDIKARIEKKIEQAQQRVIIIVDDLDRLDKDEIFQLLKIVKIIADFKGVTYLIAFDDEAVAAAISERYSTGRGKDSGRAFLEKIIQIPLHLPTIPRELLNAELLNGVDEVLKENEIEITDEEVNDFRSVYDEDIAPLIDSPRTVNRYLNSLKFTVPFVGKEVNITDFLVIEALRVFFPSEYDLFRHEKQILTGVSNAFVFPRMDEEENYETTINNLVNKNSTVLEIIKSLFPSVKNKLSNVQSYSNLTELRTEKRVASPDYFDRYFSYGIRAEDVSDTEVIQILKLDSSDKIAAGLKKLLKSKDQTLVLTKVHTYINTVKNKELLSAALLEIVEELELSSKVAFIDSPVERSVDIITEIVKEQPNRLDALKTLLDKCNNPEQLFYIIREVVLHSKPEDADKFLEETDLENFKSAVVAKIKTLSDRMTFFENESRIGFYLYQYWADFGSRDEVNAKLKSLISTSDDALKFVTLHLSRFTGGRGSRRGNFDTGVYERVNRTIDMEWIYSLVVKAYPSLSETENFPDLEHDHGSVSKEGNEESDEFKKLLAEQIIFQFKRQSKDEPESEETT